jgi:hypothetical protein
VTSIKLSRGANLAARYPLARVQSRRANGVRVIVANATTRRAREYRNRAAKLTDEAQRVRDADDRRHLLDLAECYKRAADLVAVVSS